MVQFCGDACRILRKVGATLVLSGVGLSPVRYVIMRFFDRSKCVNCCVEWYSDCSCYFCGKVLLFFFFDCSLFTKCFPGKNFLFRFFFVW